MDKFNRLSGGMKAAGVVFMVLALTSALVLLAAEKPADKTERGYLGVSVQRLDDDAREKLGVKHGVKVAAVEKDSAAAKAGIAKGDVIQSVNGEKIRDERTLVEVIRELAPGSAARIGLWRGGKALEVKAVLGKYERPKPRSWQVGPMTKVLRPGPYLGISLLELDGDLAAYFSVKAGEGVLVTQVKKETPAAKAGFRSGDVIVQMADTAIRKSGDIHEAMAALKKGDSIAVTVVRQGKRETLKAEPDFSRHQRVLRFFSGDKDKDMDIRHLELPELDFILPEFDVRIPEPPEPPDAEEIKFHMQKKLDQAHEELDHVHEKLDQAKVRIETKLKKIAENYWI
ncbi:MAG: PDZ domain-containing protein [Acidobacteria bacterium]|jgi:serine protease Do|nr:PDZ domain-containing protein [Acidobacteriota bacterium]